MNKTKYIPNVNINSYKEEVKNNSGYTESGLKLSLNLILVEFNRRNIFFLDGKNNGNAIFMPRAGFVLMYIYTI